MRDPAAADSIPRAEDAGLGSVRSYGMARAATGSVIVQTLVDGTRAYQLRFRAPGRREHETLHERRACPCGCGGGWTERTAALELENILARVRAGVSRRREVLTT